MLCAYFDSLRACNWHRDICRSARALERKSGFSGVEPLEDSVALSHLGHRRPGQGQASSFDVDAGAYGSMQHTGQSPRKQRSKYRQLHLWTESNTGIYDSR